MAIPLAARIGAMLAFREVMVFRSRGEERKRIFAWAIHRAKELGRDLIVVGDAVCAASPPVPVEGVTVRCLPTNIDISAENSIPAKKDSSIVYIMWSLEYVNDIEGAWREILRVAGSQSNVFIVHVPKQSFLAWIRPGARWVIETAPPTAPELRYLPAQSVYPSLQTVRVAEPQGFRFFGSRPYGIIAGKGGGGST